MRVLVCGDRHWTDRDYVFQMLDDLHSLFGITEVIEGCAKGADRIAGGPCPSATWDNRVGWAKARAIPIRHFPADWASYPRAAGPIRNRQMLKEGKPELVVAFHKNLNDSKGTKDMVLIAREAHVDTYIFPTGHGGV